MAYTTLKLPVAKDIFKQHHGLRRSDSAKPLCKPPAIHRSCSDTNLCYSVNTVRPVSTQPKLNTSPSVAIFPSTLRSFLFDPKAMDLIDKDHVHIADISQQNQVQRSNWVERLMEIRKQWAPTHHEEAGNANLECDAADCQGLCEVDYASDDEQQSQFKYDRQSFSALLAPVSWADTKYFSQLAFLSNMAYVIQDIKEQDLRRYYNLQFVTSSLQKKQDAAAMKAKLDHDYTSLPVHAPTAAESNSKNRPLVASKIAASAASYVHSRAKGLMSLASPSREEDNDRDSVLTGDQPQEEEPRVYKSEVAAYVAASTMTAVVAAGDKERKEAARDLQSLHSSPCEWFVCDDPSTYTRCFVIQGSDSLASWQANLFFEPTKFEGTDVIVHRGIYEAAKGIYKQFMPEIIDHLKRHGDRAKLQFTGHSLGGSLSLLVNLMLLTRKVVKPSAVRPVVTFGSPFVFCGGQKILDYLGLDESHIHCVMMHRDIVPRAFSCNYPDHVALVLKRLNGSFQSHPCLLKNKLLYSPLGKLFIIQPNEDSSPSHPLLPDGSALYTLENTRYSANALRSFLNNPHPLETLSDPTAYGSEGTILRDHDSSNYLKAVNGVLRQQTKLLFREARKERDQLWPLLTSPSPQSWSHESNLLSSRSVTKEVMTGV